MKAFLLSLLVLGSISAQAKLTVFGSKQALQVVANDEATIAKVLTKSNTDTLKAISVESIETNVFEVKVTSTKLDSSCETEVFLKSKPEVVVLPSGAKIATNKLVVSKIGSVDCR